MKLITFLFSLFLFSCSTGKKEPENISGEIKSDTMEIIRGFIYGLWSMDSGNILINEGYYFQQDGKVDFIASDYSGTWELLSTDSLKIIFPSFNKLKSSSIKIDSLSEGRMVLSDHKGKMIFRKVPFGMNREGTVLQGFAGQIEAGSEREYSINILSAKKMELRLNSKNEGIKFNIYDGQAPITSTPLRNWTAIMIRNGKYRVVVSNPKNNQSKEDGAFDLKVIGY